MQATIQKWGNSLGVRIPSLIAKDLSLHNGSTVEIIEKGDQIIIKASPKESLKDLLNAINDQNIHSDQFAKQSGSELL